MNLEVAVQDLVHSCSGATAAAIVDPDGITVAMQPEDRVLEEAAAQFATILRDVAQAERELQHGPLRQFAVYAEQATVVLTMVSAGYFLVLQLGRDGFVGQARFRARLVAERLYSEFI